MKEKFPASIEVNHDESLAIEIARLLEEVNDNDPDFERGCPTYNMSDIFRCLPHSITYNGHRGDLSVSCVDIAYFSVNNEWKHVLVHHEPIPNKGDIYNAFCNMIKWLKENNLM